MNNDAIMRAMGDPRAALQALDKFEAEQSLINFMRLGWHTLEPGMPLHVSWGLEAICDHLEAVTRNEITRLLINVPPGCSKSMSTNVFWPAWEWGPKGLPHYRYVSFAHERDLAVRDNMRCRNLIQSDWYQANWGDGFGFKDDQNAKVYYENTKTGWRQACAAVSLTGRRGDRVLGDDPHSVKGADSDAKREEVLQIFSETVPTRLNKMDESAIIVIMQRVHERDVSGLILAEELGYEHLMLPMEFEESRRCYSIVPPSYMENPEKVPVVYNKDTFSWQPASDPKAEGVELRYNTDAREHEGDLLDPVRFSAKSLEQLKKALRAWGGSYAEAGQLQQRPAPRGGGMFQRKDYQFLDDARGLTGRIVRGWDLAASDGKKSPNTAGVKMMLTTDGRIVILDVNCFRKTPGAVEDEITNTVKQDGHNVTQDFPQDPGQAGKSQKAAFARMLHGYTIQFSPESGSKESRATPLAAQLEAGNLYLVRAPWNDQFINEGALFPNGQFKDRIDAASRAYSALIRKRARRVAAAPEVVHG